MKLMINDFMEQKLWLGRTHFFHFGKEKSWGAVKNQSVYVKEDDHRKALRLVELVNYSGWCETWIMSCRKRHRGARR